MSDKHNAGCSLIIFIALFCLIIYCANTVTPPGKVLQDKTENTVVKNKKYLFCYDWAPEDPFEKPVIDTVVVLDMKKGYVQYKVCKWKFISSCSIERFIKYTKPVKK